MSRRTVRKSRGRGNVVNLIDRFDKSRRLDARRSDGDDVRMRELAEEFFAVIREAGLDYHEVGELLQHVHGDAPTAADICELAHLLTAAAKRRPTDPGAAS
jgi:hypothetical protein